VVFRYRITSPAASLLAPEEQDDWLNELAGGGASLLGVIGNILDTPGSFVRNTLAGRWGDLLPGIVDPERRISGRDLLEKAGVVSRNKKGFDFGDVLGFGAEVVTDPLTLIGGGVTKAGAVAKSLGKFPKRSTFDVGTGLLKEGKRAARRGTLGSVLEGAGDDVLKHAELLAEKRGARLADLLDEPMQRSLGVGLPFKENFATFDLPGAARRADALDWLGGKARMSTPGRYIAKAFDRRVNDVGDWAGQRAAAAATDEADSAKMAASADINVFHQRLMDAGVTDQDLQSDIIEGISRHPDAPQRKLTESEVVDFNIKPLPGEAPEALAARKALVTQTRQDFQQSIEGLRRQREAQGLPAARFESERVDFAHREATYPQYGTAKSSMRRREEIRDLGATEVDRIVRDPTLRQLAKLTEVDPLAPEQLTREVPEEIVQDLANMGYEDLTDLVDWQATAMRNADPQRAEWNAVAEGVTDAPPEMSRTTAIPKPRTHHDNFRDAVKRVDELMGREPADWDKSAEWFGQAKQLPRLQDELAELEGRIAAGEMPPPIDRQIYDATVQLQQAEADAAAYAARRQDLDARSINSPGEYLKKEEVEELGALLSSANQRDRLRAKLKRLADKRDAGNFQPNAAEMQKDLADEIGLARVAEAQLDALDARAKQAKWFIKHSREVPQEAIDKGHRFFGNTRLFDAAAEAGRSIDEIAFTKQAHKQAGANQVYIPPGEEVDKIQFEPVLEFYRSLGVGRTANEQSFAIRQFADQSRRYGKFTQEEFDNIAGPHAVATSAVKQRPDLAQELRTAEITDYTARSKAQFDKQVAGITVANLSGAEKAKRIADLESRFSQVVSEGVAKIHAKPLPETSHAGKLMGVKRSMAQTLKDNADEARLSGTLGPDEHAALYKEADDWVKGKRPVSDDVKEYERLWQQAVADDPIPNDGLLRLKNTYIPKDIADALRNAKRARYDVKQEGFLGWVDWWRNLTKGHLTMPFASYHIRNIENMGYQYAAAGVRDPRHGLVRGFLQPWKDAYQILQGQSVKDFDDIPAIATMGLKGRDAERQLIAAAESYADLKGAGDLVSEAAEPAFTGHGKKAHEWGTTVEQFTAGLPGGRPLNKDYLLEPLGKQFGAARFDPSNIKHFIPAAIGARLGNATENLGRLATFIGLLRQGKSFEEAGALVKAMHVDYSNLTRFERDIVRRVIPFYSWSRHMVPYVLRQFVEKPAGLYAQTARVARLGQQDAGFLPPQLSGSLAIPIGQEEGGTQRYLSQFDTPAEALNKLVNPTSLGDTVRSVLAQTDPTVKLAIETGTGINLFRGRNVADLESPTGRIAANLTGADEPLWKTPGLDTALSNSPLSRYIGTLSQAGDNRKGWGTKAINSLTGLRLTDVDIPKANRIAIGKAAQEMLRDMGAPTISKARFSKDDLEKLLPEDRAKAKQLQAILNELAKDWKAEREKAK
jgi:hypothetical protein